MNKPRAYYWVKAKLNQMAVLFGLKPDEYAYLNYVILKEVGFEKLCEYDARAIMLSLDYP